MKYEEHRVFINLNPISHYFYYQLHFLHGHNLILPLKHLDNNQQSNPRVFNQLFLNTYSPSCFISTSSSFINNLQLFFTISWLFYYSKTLWIKSRVEFNHTTISCLFLNSHHPPPTCQLFRIVVVGMILVTAGGSRPPRSDQKVVLWFRTLRPSLPLWCGVSSSCTIPEVNVVWLCWLYCFKCRDKVYPYRSKLKGVDGGLFLNPLMKMNSYTRKEETLRLRCF